MTARLKRLGTTCSWSAAALLGALVFLYSVPTVAETKAWLTPLHTGSQALAVGGDRVTVTLPVAVAEADPQKIRVAAVSLFQRSVGRTVTLEGKEATYIPGQGGATPRLKLELPLAAFPADTRFGPYDLALDVWEGERKGPLATVTVTFPESVFAQPDKLVLKVTDAFGLFRGVEPASVWLRVSEGPAPTEARLSQAGPALHGSEPAGGLLAFDHVPQLDKSAPVRVAVHEVAEFPRGESTGQILLSGPDNKPVVIPFAVQVRSLPVVISIIAFVGVVMGWAVRNKLTVWQEARQAELQVGKVRDALAGELLRRRDRKLAKVIGDLQERLEAAFRGLWQSSASAAADITKIQEELAAAVADSEGRRTDILGRIASLEEALKHNWKLPSKVSRTLTDARSKLQGAYQDALRWNVDGAETAQEGAERVLCDALNRWLEAWKADIAHLRQLETLVGQGSNFGADVRDAVTKLVAAETQDVVSGVEGLHKGLGNVQGITASWKTLWVRVLTDLGITCDVVIRSLPPATAGSSDVTMAMENLDARRGDAVELPEGLTQLPGLIQDTLAVCHGAIGSANGSGRPSVKEALAQRDYRKAAAELGKTDADVPRSGDLGRITRPQETAGAVAGAGTPSLEPAAQSLSPLPPLPPRVVVNLPPMASSLRSVIDINIPQTMTAISRGRGLQLLVSAAGFASLAFPIFSPTFMGTFSDIFGVWAWGFTMDLGVGSLVQQLQSRYPGK